MINIILTHHCQRQGHRKHTWTAVREGTQSATSTSNQHQHHQKLLNIHGKEDNALLHNLERNTSRFRREKMKF